jgi:hypothetical protein
MLVAAGWAEVKKNRDGNVHSEKKDLEDLQKQAEAAKACSFCPYLLVACVLLGVV